MKMSRRSTVNTVHHLWLTFIAKALSWVCNWLFAGECWVEPSQELILLNKRHFPLEFPNCICQNGYMYLSKLQNVFVKILNVFLKLAKCMCSECWAQPSQELVLLNHSRVTSRLSFWGKHISAQAVTSADYGQLVAHCQETSTRMLSSRPEYVWRSACELSTFLTSEWWPRWSESCRRKRGWESSFWVSILYFSKLLNVFVKFAKCIFCECACWTESCRRRRGWESSFLVSILYLSNLLNVFDKFAKCIFVNGLVAVSLVGGGEDEKAVLKVSNCIFKNC